MKQRPRTHGDLQKSLKRAAPTILTCLSAVGMVLTIVTAVKATPKAMELLKEATAEKRRRAYKSGSSQSGCPCLRSDSFTRSIDTVLYVRCKYSEQETTGIIHKCLYIA